MEGTVENANGSTILKNSWFYTFIQGCISAVIGLILMIFPTIGVVFVSLVFSFYLIWLGISQIVLSFKFSSIQKNWWIILIRGLIMLISGLVILSFPISFGNISVGIPLILLGLFLIFYGVVDLLSNKLPGSGIHHVISSIIMILTGVLLCLASAAAAEIIFRILGFTVFAGGILQGIQAFYSRKWVQSNMDKPASEPETSKTDSDRE
ncbi:MULTISPECIES: HdeD family acid-resistance protein [unclassified Oceanispirochaeta]|uniref:HdeD family acid-resistance protein n=1 Tax=unclassified Oceanispirochaeta TaxID=2635722 RepID=UPI000E097B90|nr:MULTISPECIES: DUF308 domain-containing protein [unclassified Oceanispirochaeta]MBF9015632.1 DUF308 domain-containing protein [Oceanispirochaeta sp. M2]NPD73406.1 DUF308 domain-containing protein [Oceanispirochaeta sp. M1]RDG30880.1 DUF308 domain-containing protein [Oceanispirochaeta sp. M1]